MSRKTNREYEREVLVERDIAPTPRECEELRIPTPPPGQYDLRRSGDGSTTESSCYSPHSNEVGIRYPGGPERPPTTPASVLSFKVPHASFGGQPPTLPRPPPRTTPGKAQVWPRASEGTKRSPV